MLRFGVRRFLSDNQLRVCWDTACSNDARQMLARELPDLVIYEPFYELSCSVEFLGFLRVEYPDLKVIVQSMAIESADVSRILKQGVLALVSKSGELRELLLAIEAAHQGQAYVSPSILNTMRPDPGSQALNVSSLTARELEVFRLIGLWQKASEIATTLGISPRTVEAHKQHIKDKLSLQGNINLGAAAVAWLHRSCGHRP